MITCRELLDFLHDYVEGTLSANDRAKFERHLSVCDPCVHYLAEYRKTIRLAKSANGAKETNDTPAEPLPEALVRAILEARTSRRKD